MTSASLGFGDFGMFDPAVITGDFSEFSSSSAPSTSTTAVAPVATQIQEPSITTAIPTTTTATTATTETTQSTASTSSVSYTIVRVLTTADTITRHPDLHESDVSIERHLTSDTEGIATVTVNANAAAPPSDDGFIATFTIESTRTLLMAIITNTHEENADEDVVDACDHFFLVIGEREAVGSAFETKVHLYAKVHDGDFLFSRLNDDSFSFNLVASSGG